LPEVTSVGEPVADENQGEYVQSVERGVAVIRAFGLHRTTLTITDVAQATGLTRATARRFLLTLERMGYVRHDGRNYSLRPRVLELGYAYVSGFSLIEVAEPFLNGLMLKAQESTSIAVRDGSELVYVAHTAPQRMMTINVPVGGRDPLYCTALGRVLLAAQSDEEIDSYLAVTELFAHTAATTTAPAQLREDVLRVRKDGYSLIEDQLEDGLVAMAVPLRDAGGTVVAAMNICAYSPRTSPEGLRANYLPLLRQTAADIEQEMSTAVQHGVSQKITPDKP
jgi:IclR family transcriptional regulator, pca regulon regulatory protein